MPTNMTESGLGFDLVLVLAIAVLILIAPLLYNLWKRVTRTRLTSRQAIIAIVKNAKS